MTHLTEEKILVLDFGSQYAQLIARRIREQNVYALIVRHDISAERVREIAPRGLVFSGGPASVQGEDSPRCDPDLFQLSIPILGICYGMQLVCQALGGRVESGRSREYGRAQCRLLEENDLLRGLPEEFQVWMSHGDQVTAIPADFVPLAATASCPLVHVDGDQGARVEVDGHRSPRSATASGRSTGCNFTPK